jgi:IS66 C-terminal element
MRSSASLAMAEPVAVWTSKNLRRACAQQPASTIRPAANSSLNPAQPRRAAAIYSLIETAKLNGLNPQHYLADVLIRIADHPARRIAELLPWNWQPLDAARAAA